MRKKLVLCLICLFCLSMLFGCGTSSNGNDKDPYSGQEMTDKDEGNTGNAVEGVVGDIMDDTADVVEDIGTAFSNLIGDATDLREVDYTPLEERRGEMPEDMVAYLDLMKLEKDSPSMVASDNGDHRTIGLTLSEMLERGVLFENHIKKYPDGKTADAAKRFYEEIATNAITGGYDKANGIEHYYKGQAEGYIDEKSLAYYEQFVEANPDSNLAQIVKEYIGILQKNKFQITDEVDEFYHGLYNRLMFTDSTANPTTPTAPQTGTMNSENGQVGTQGLMP